MLDTMTVIITQFVISFILIIVSIMFWRQHRKDSPFIYLWPLFFVYGVITFGILLLYPYHPLLVDVISAMLLISHAYLFNLTMNKVHGIKVHLTFNKVFLVILCLLTLHDVIEFFDVELTGRLIFIGVTYYFLEVTIQLFRRYMATKNIVYLFFNIATTPIIIYLIIRATLFILFGVQYEQHPVYEFEAIFILFYIFMHLMILVAIIYYRHSSLIADLNKKQEQLERAMKNLRNLADRDELTNAYNRRFMNFALHSEAERHNRYGGEVSLILLDIDHFKQINDTYGHDIGDRVLVTLSKIIQENLRTTDTFARWGGEEFLILLPHTNQKNAVIKAEQLREAIETESGKEGIPITCSFGVSEKFITEGSLTWTKKTDVAMYRAKDRGRNRVEPSGSSTPVNVEEFVWTDQLLCGIPIIDDAHKLLVEEVRKLYNDIRPFEQQVESLDVIYNHCVSHFTEEELEMEQHGFGGVTQHKAIHAYLLTNAENIIRQYKEKSSVAFDVVLEIIEDLVIKHLLIEDAKFFRYLSEKNNVES